MCIRDRCVGRNVLRCNLAPQGNFWWYGVRKSGKRKVIWLPRESFWWYVSKNLRGERNFGSMWWMFGWLEPKVSKKEDNLDPEGCFERSWSQTALFFLKGEVIDVYKRQVLILYSLPKSSTQEPQIREI